MSATWLETRDVPIRDLTRFPGNARRGNVDEIRKSIRRHGQYRAIVVRVHDGQMTVLAGNHTTEALEAEGHDTARCELIECTDGEARRIAVADNRLGELGGYDDHALAELLAGLDGDLDGTGWADEDVAPLLKADEHPGVPSQDDPGAPSQNAAGGGAPETRLGRTDPDEAPEAPAAPVTKPGDLYRLGDHWLLCGDSTKRSDVTRIMDGERACLMVTDPPYGVVFGGDKGKNSIAGDLTQAAIPVSFGLAVEEALDDDARVYLFGGSGNWQMYAGLFDFHLRMQVRPIVWAKEHFVLRPNGYHSQFEMVYYGWKGRGGANDRWYGDRKTSDLWAVSRNEDHEKVHPTQKPVELCAIPVRNSSPEGGLVYEPFGGSGSTLIACHLLGRRCRVIELDPKYCDIILRRFERNTGIKPERVLEDGTTEPASFT